MKQLILISSLFFSNLLSINAQDLKPIPADPNYEQSMIDAGFVDISTCDASIRVRLKYSTTDNFVKTDVYGKLTNAYLQPAVAKMLARAQQKLKELHPDYSLVIFDAARPLKVQKMMWKLIHVPEKKKRFYLADPNIGSLHNYGCAVDLSITDSKGVELDMGTPFDYFGEKAYPIKEKALLAKGILTKEQLANRIILRKCMFDAGFEGTTTEWWHFNACSRKTAKNRYKIIP